MSWLRFMDECVADACLVLTDGSTIPFSGSTGHVWLDEDRIANSSGGWDGTIDVHAVAALQIAGQQIALLQ